MLDRQMSSDMPFDPYTYGQPIWVQGSSVCIWETHRGLLVWAVPYAYGTNAHTGWNRFTCMCVYTHTCYTHRHTYKHTLPPWCMLCVYVQW